MQTAKNITVLINYEENLYIFIAVPDIARRMGGKSATDSDRY
jgi:hypothetical protein